MSFEIPTFIQPSLSVPNILCDAVNNPDVTDTSNVKVKFGFLVASTGGSMKIYASSTTNRTYFNFIRLGDT